MPFNKELQELLIRTELKQAFGEELKKLTLEELIKLKGVKFIK